MVEELADETDSAERHAILADLTSNVAMSEEHAVHAEHATRVRHPAFAAALCLGLAADIGKVLIEPKRHVGTLTGGGAK
ncbi:hypothetical protein [Rubrivirga sp. IMCC43871]|uniref:hypothetical protein n=1 Tax=Rubrivirga sp. IMCC43871 TaxID=3391575 RepID=UPI00398FFA56